MRKSNKSLGVDWLLPNKKRRFATTTMATSQLIVLLAEDGLTVQEAHDQINYDPEGKTVLQFFIDHGYGDSKLDTLVG